MFRHLKSENEHNHVTWRSHIRAHHRLARAVWLARRAILAVKLRRLQGELLCHTGLSVEA